MACPPLFKPARRRLLQGAAATLALPLLARAAGYPERPLTFICPWPAGGTADMTMRALCSAAAKVLGQTVVVDNKAGASGMLGLRAMAGARPDGYTIGGFNDSLLTMVPNLNPNTPFNPVTDFAHVSLVANIQFSAAVATTSSYKTLADIKGKRIVMPSPATC